MIPHTLIRDGIAYHVMLPEEPKQWPSAVFKETWVRYETAKAAAIAEALENGKYDDEYQEKVIDLLPVEAWEYFNDEKPKDGLYPNPPGFPKCERVWQQHAKHSTGWYDYKGPEWMIQHERSLSNSNFEYRTVVRFKAEEKQNENMKTGIELIAQERREQIEKHGRTIEQDIRLNSEWPYALPKAASTLTLEPMNALANTAMPEHWDRDIVRKMLEKSYKDRLIIAGALIAAEIDRLQYGK